MVFQKFPKTGLEIKLSKCQIFKTHLHYLGHRISANGLEPLPEKPEAIKKPSTHQKHRWSMSNLWIVRLLQVICSSFSDITLPITSLLKKNIPFVWSNKWQLALNYLKEIFCNKPILQFPDTNKPYILYTDASNNAYSGVLCQPINKWPRY